MKKSALRRPGDHDIDSDGSWPDGASAPAKRQADIAAYVADFTTELAQLARTAKLDLLAYLLDVANLEAKTQQRNLSAEVGEG